MTPRIGIIAASIRGVGSQVSVLNWITEGSVPNVEVLPNSVVKFGTNAVENWHKAKGDSSKVSSSIERYFEVTVTELNSAALAIGVAISGASTLSGSGNGGNAGSGGRLQYFADGRKRADNVYSDYATPYVIGDVIGCSIKLNSHCEIRFYKNGVDLGVAWGVNPEPFEPHVCFYPGQASSEARLKFNNPPLYLPTNAVVWKD